MPNNKYYSRNNLISTFLIGVLVGFGVYSMWDNSAAVKSFVKQDGDTQEKGDATEESLNEGSLLNTNKDYSGVYTFSAKDQPAGLKVFIDSATMDEQGWIVIHEDREGTPGNILGARRFEVGVSAGEVELLRNTVEGGIYYAMIHTDDGDGQFDHTKDLPLIENDAPVMVKFSAIRAH
ncbi:MAG: hypothetical protein NUV42_03020 [Candidatus Yonathbacteria bacterium]|nr:hypothetical protein [Candidatus Yonathbacteria bacterium]